MLNKAYFIWILGGCFIKLLWGSRTGFNIERFELCNKTQGLIKYHGVIVKENGNHYMSYNMTTPVPWDDNLGMSWLIQTKGVGNTYVDLFNIREKSLCKATSIYLGEFLYDILRASQINPGTCPILPGKYHAHHVLLDFNKISLQTFPFGRMRFFFKAINNKDPTAHMWCLLIEVENPLN